MFDWSHKEHAHGDIQRSAEVNIANRKNEYVKCVVYVSGQI